MDFLTPNIKTFQVFPDVPSPLQPLLEMAHNLWWVWHPDAAELFRRLDRNLWEEVNHNPVKLLGIIDQKRLSDAAGNDGYLAQLNRVYDAFQYHLRETGWFGKAHADVSGQKSPFMVAYFSAEFGLHESLPVYSGGLGVLAGDHLKSASEIGLPLVAVGLLYRNGYFQQYLSADGWQQEAYPELDFYNLPVEPVKYTDGSPVQVRVDLPENAVFCKVWLAKVGRVPLYLLDTNLPENSPADREITGKLYGGGPEMRIKQEIVLGIGGVRALEALNVQPTVFHMNEGHSAFLALERIRVLLQNSPLSFDQARQYVMATNVFTTHTPVPAGIDTFSPDMMAKYFKNYYPTLKLDEEGFLALGREDVTNKKQGFSMAVLAIRLADSVNGVSALHGDVSRKMWHNLWPQVPPDEVPLQHITNGIHVRSWLAADMVYILDRYLSSKWQTDPTDQSVWEGVTQIPDEELWRCHERCREKLVGWVRGTLKDQLTRRGAPFDDIAIADEVLDPEALTIGFARRFAGYKRGALLLRDVSRLQHLLEDAKRPIQFIFAGKAHPADHEGKELIKALVNFARNPAVRRKMVFLENYDINIARSLVQGVDVWLNTPRRGMEASGTSGMKASANGVLNCSILDGWWVEGYTPDVGWAIGRGESYSDYNTQDQLESQALYEILEKQIIPLFYKRTVDNIPREWISRMKTCMRKLAPVFNTNRMVREYTEKFYIPADVRGQTLAANNLERSVNLAKAKEMLRQRWGGIKVVGVHVGGNGHYRVGENMQVEALVDLPDVDPREVVVELYSGPITATGQIGAPHVLRMNHSKQIAGARHVFSGQIECRTSGRQGFAVRVLPGNADMATPFEPGLISWN
ncbi:MAG TPA: alpha-glucan family phosphorylase [Tepidisphaeraceae bacterium]|jgi:starch phosphorylase|nr:alpha-glucan family phosphorylase [Tepidisphaeraceae bacterium]